MRSATGSSSALTRSTTATRPPSGRPRKSDGFRSMVFWPSLLDAALDPERSTDAVLLGGALLLLSVAVAACLRTCLLSARLRRQSDFIAGLAHDLRTPLTQLRLFSESLLLNRLRTEEERMFAARVMARESCRVILLAENLLQHGRAERGVPPPAAAPFRLRAVVEEAVDALTPLAGSAGSSIELLPGDATVIADRTSVARIVTNLLDNALQHGPEGQRIRVAISAFAQGVRLTVDDQGPGVQPKLRDSIWKPFHTLGRHGGTGLGLAIVRELCRSNRGTCSVEDAPGGGARFVARFPACDEATAPALLCEGEAV